MKDILERWGVGTRVRYPYITIMGGIRAMLGRGTRDSHTHWWTRAQISRFERAERRHLKKLEAGGFITRADINRAVELYG